MPSPQPSAALIAANKQLHQLRAQLKGDRVPAAPRPAAPHPQYCTSDTPVVDRATMLDKLPAHLGWGSQPLAAVLRRRPQGAAFHHKEEVTACFQPPTNKGRETAPEPEDEPTVAQQWVKLYPDIGLGMLRQEQTAPGRLWLMLRLLDKEGRGALRIDNYKDRLTLKKSPWRLCGKRQLRNLLRDGEGLFWTRDKTHIWLRSAAKVAYGLGVEQLTGQPVALPAAALLEGIGTFRAHLYTAFHSGRTKETVHGTKVMPIARDTLTDLSGVGRSSQRAYESEAGVTVQTNFAVGEIAGKEQLEKRAWEKGQALFTLKDYRGQQGKKGRMYLAWQLPNSYFGQHRHRPKGRQKRINRELKDLVMKGMPGNVEETSETSLERLQKRYFPHGKAAVKVHSRDPQRELYWKRHETQTGLSLLWQYVGA